jgi:cyanate lyase
VRIYREVIEKRMSELGLNAEKLREKLGFKSVGGWNKILREGSTKEKTIKDIAEHLGVHASFISPDIEAPKAFREGTANKVYEELLSHEKAIKKLQRHIIQLYKELGRELSQDEIEDILG